MISAPLANAIVVVVTIVWVISFVVSIFSPVYKPDPQINVIFMGIVGGSLALKAKRGTGDEDKK